MWEAWGHNEEYNSLEVSILFTLHLHNWHSSAYYGNISCYCLFSYTMPLLKSPPHPNTVVDWNDINTLMASQLIPLDKYTGVRTIGVGENLYLVMGKRIKIELFRY